MTKLSLLCPLLAVCVLRTDSSPQFVGKFSYPQAAFSSLYPRHDGPGFDLLLSSFGLFGSDVSVVSDVGQFINNVGNIHPVSISTAMKWPNEISGVPAEVVKPSLLRYVVIPDGFLVPTKGHGSLTLYQLDSVKSLPFTISSVSADWFYHRVLWVDMDKDGDLDALTCRANVPLIGSAHGELVWFTNPTSHSFNVSWKEQVISTGPDVYFAVANLSVSATQTYEVIVVAEFFHSKLGIYWTDDPKQNWTNLAEIKYRDIDTNIGKPFDVLLSDINGDKKLDLLVTTNSDRNGTVLIYQIPDDFRTGIYTRHLLADGYHSQSVGINKGGPGSPYILPSSSPKPSILIAGDDSAVVSLFSPSHPNDPMDWSYSRDDFLRTGSSTTGGLSLADVDGDGSTELFVPSYDEGVVYVYRFSSSGLVVGRRHDN